VSLQELGKERIASDSVVLASGMLVSEALIVKNFILAALMTLSFCVRVQAGNQRLIGTWKSNKEVTLQYLKTRTKLTLQQLDKVGSVLGKMVIVFDSERMTAKSGDCKFTTKHTIVEETKNGVTIEAEDPGTKKLTRTKFTLDAAGFWTPDDKIPGYQERFDKVAEE
jgi:hypothetical protein